MTKLLSLIVLTALFSPFAKGNEIVISHQLPSAQKKFLQQDLNNLSTFKFSTKAEQKTLSLFEIKTLNSATASKWLSDRVQAILEDKDSREYSVTIKETSWDYPFLNEIPSLTPTPRDLNSLRARSMTVMTNIGTSLYLQGKIDQTLYQIEVPTSPFKRKKYITLSSPRAGVVKVGSGLFSRSYQANRKSDNAVSNSLLRLSVLFHEARHSDGHGKNVGFIHIVCPDGHALAGHRACDDSSNGSYAVGAQIIKEFLSSCTDCSVSEKELLKLHYLDSLSRIVDGSKEIDPSPEGKRL